MNIMSKLLFIALLLTSNSWAATDCTVLLTQTKAAYNQKAITTLRRLVADIEHCTKDERTQMNRWLGELLWNDVLTRENSGATAASLEPLLQETVRYAALWQAFSALGDIYAERKKHEKATEYYQKALDTLDDAEQTPKAPSQAAIAKLFKKAEVSRLLAAQYVPATSKRNGDPGGLASLGVRGFSVKQVAVPVEFEFDSVKLTTKGQQAAADLLAQLTLEQPAVITLIGHTDPKGSDAYNDRLSRQRAEALAAYLRAQGYSGTIHTDGRGKREPMQLDDSSQLSQDELYQVYRRVELHR